MAYRMDLSGGTETIIHLKNNKTIFPGTTLSPKECICRRSFRLWKVVLGVDHIFSNNRNNSSFLRVETETAELSSITR